MQKKHVPRVFAHQEKRHRQLTVKTNNKRKIPHVIEKEEQASEVVS